MTVTEALALDRDLKSVTASRMFPREHEMLWETVWKPVLDDALSGLIARFGA